jgi:peptidyl-prolyl cis-trans isomerase SurA
MRKQLLSWLVLAALPLCSILAQVDDPVVMNVAGEDVRRSEFEYSFNKNNDAEGRKDVKAINAYVDLFVNYKLKVKAAKEAHLDTLGSFIKEFRTYRDMQLKPHVSDEAYVDSVAYEIYKNVKTAVGDSDLIHVAHIFLALPQKDSGQLKDVKKNRIDSIYTALQNGADFAEMARKYSEDRFSGQQGGELPWIGPKQTLPEFEKQAYALQPGQMSKPFLSTAGYHILLMKERKKLEPFEQKKSEIVELLRKRGIDDVAQEHKIGELMAKGNKTREQVMAEIQADAEKEDSSLHYLIDEYHDGLLLYEASKRFVWDPAAKDEAGLKSFFKKNRKQYKWDAPHFKGYVVMSKREAMKNEVESFLKKYDDNKGVDALNKKYPKDSLRTVRVRYGVYKEGEDAIVDHAMFGKPAPKQNAIYPYVGVVGKLIAQPKTYEDVKARVVSDYQDAKEKEWVAGLRKKYTYKVYDDVLKTVNNHTSN